MNYSQSDRRPIIEIGKIIRRGLEVIVGAVTCSVSGGWCEKSTICGKLRGCCICSNCKLYLSEYEFRNVFVLGAIVAARCCASGVTRRQIQSVKIDKFICPSYKNICWNYDIYLSKMRNVFFQIVELQVVELCNKLCVREKKNLRVARLLSGLNLLCTSSARSTSVSISQYSETSRILLFVQITKHICLNYKLYFFSSSSARSTWVSMVQYFDTSSQSRLAGSVKSNRCCRPQNFSLRPSFS